MKISTKGRYGLRAMLDMAVHSSGDIVTLKSIAERQSISEGYLEQVFAGLRKAGLVKSIKGAQGGYILSDSPENIKVWSILTALEGDLSIIGNNNEDALSNNIFERCISQIVWERVDNCIRDLLNGITLEDLLTEYKKSDSNLWFMYYI